MSTPQSTPSVYVPPPDRQCGKEALILASKSGLAGLFLGSAHLAWNHVIPHGYTVPRYLAARSAQGAALGGLYALASCTYTDTLHASKDAGSAFGGFMTGAAIGLHHRSFGMAVGLGAGFALAGFIYELNDRSWRGPIGSLSVEARNKYNMESFWKNPAESPVSRALDVADRARQQA